jgi:hypothetical protein
MENMLLKCEIKENRKMENTIYQVLSGTGEETTIRVSKKSVLRKALEKVFGDNAECYLAQAIKSNNGYELSLYNNYAIQVYQAL